MAFHNRVRENISTSTAAIEVSLSGAVTGHVTFATLVAIGATGIPYVIEDGDNYEIGQGTLVNATTFRRATVVERKENGVFVDGNTGRIALSGSAQIFIAVSASFLNTVPQSQLTAAEIKTLYESNANTNEFSDAEQTKLASIETGATADQTASEIKTAYESNPNTNAFTNAEQTKLAGVETGATADQTAAEIKTAYESNADTNAFTDAEQTKLGGIQTGAEVNVQANWNTTDNLQDSFIQNKPTFLDEQPINTASTPTFAGMTITPGSITDATLPTLPAHLTNKQYVDGEISTATAPGAVKTAYESNSNTNVFTDAEQTKLAGIQAGAEVNIQADWNETNTLSDAFILNKPGGLTDPPTFQGANFVLATGDGPIVAFSKPSNQTVPDSSIAQLTFSSQDNTGATNQYARIVVETDDQRPGVDRQGSIVFKAMVNGVEQNIAVFNTRDNPGDATYNGGLVVAMDGEIRNGNLELGAVGPTAAIFNGKTTSQTTISGGSSAALGANLTFFGEQNASNPNDWEFKTGTVLELSFDSSANTFNFQGNRVRNIDNLAGSDSSGSLALVSARDNLGGAAPSSIHLRSNQGFPPLRSAIIFRAPDPNNVSIPAIVLDWDNNNQHWDFYDNDIVRVGSFGLGSASELTIASGAVTVTKRWHTLDTEADGVTDTLTNISGAPEGGIVTFRQVDAARVITIDNTGNIKLAGGTFTFGSVDDIIEFINDGGVYKEISRSVNT